MFEFILSLREREREHGARFSYRSIETDVLAFVLERATGKRLPQLLSEELWQKLGMEESASMTVDPAGFALADGGLNACLRDYARFGQMILEDGAGIVPARWIEATRAGDHALFGEPYTAVAAGRRLSQPVLDRGPQAPQPDGARRVRPAHLHRLGAADGGREALELADFVNPAWTVATLDAVRRIGAALSRSGSRSRGSGAMTSQPVSVIST